MKKDGVTHVKYLPDGWAVLYVQFKGEPRRTLTTQAAADAAVKRTNCVAYDKHNRRDK